MQVLKEFFPELMVAGVAVILIAYAVKKVPLPYPLRWILHAMLYTAVLMRERWR